MKKEDILTETEQILLHNYEKYYRVAYSYMQNQEDALDVVQESAYKAVRDCTSIQNEHFLSTWIYRIVINTALDMLRKRNREIPSTELSEEVWEDQYGEMDLKTMLEHLDEKSRAVILLRYFEDLKLEEIAEITGENLSTIKARLYRTLKKLRLSLESPTCNKLIQNTANHISRKGASL